MGKRMVLGFDEDTVSELDRLAKKRNVSKIEVVRRALAIYMLVDEELAKGKGIRQIAIVEKGDISASIAFI